MVKIGVVMRSANMLEGKGVCLRTDIYNTRTEGPGAGTINVFGIEEAEMVGANAVCRGVGVRAT